MTVDTTIRNKPFVIKSICRSDIINCVLDMQLSDCRTEHYIKIIDNLDEKSMEEIAKHISSLIFKNDKINDEHIQDIFERFVRI